jgi:hypothetical protein
VPATASDVVAAAPAAAVVDRAQATPTVRAEWFALPVPFGVVEFFETASINLRTQTFAHPVPLENELPELAKVCKHKDKHKTQQQRTTTINIVCPHPLDLRQQLAHLQPALRQMLRQMAPPASCTAPSPQRWQIQVPEEEAPAEAGGRIQAVARPLGLDRGIQQETEVVEQVVAWDDGAACG